MKSECGCETREVHRTVRCQECGAVLCPTCAIKVDLDAYCRWCAVSAPFLVLA